MTTLSIPTPHKLGAPAKYTLFRPYPNGESQFDTVLSLISSITRFTALQAETGIGKSLIYSLAAKLLDYKTLILCLDNTLLEQLFTDFHSVGLEKLKGRRHYTCRATLRGGEYYTGIGSSTCDKAPCTFGDPCTYRNLGCDYYDTERIARESRLTLTNYSKWLVDPNSLGADYDLLICDEAHKIPGIVEDYMKVELDAREFDTLLKIRLPEDEDDLIDWCKVALGLTEDLPDEYKETRQELAKKVRLLQRADLSSWVKEITSKGQKYSIIWAGSHLEKLLYRGIKNVWFISAYLTGKTLDYLDVERNDVTKIDVGSIFPATNRPIVFFSQQSGHMVPIKVKKAMTDASMKIWVKQIDWILERHPDVKGIIHCVSYEWGRKIWANSRYSNTRLLVHDSKNFDSAMEKFKSSKLPLVLISPRVTEGYDFGFVHFQIISKLPFIWSKEPVMKAKNESDKHYSNYLIAVKLVQTAGRIVRSSRKGTIESVGITYIIDEHFRFFKNMAESIGLFPQSFWKALICDVSSLEDGRLKVVDYDV